MTLVGLFLFLFSYALKKFQIRFLWIPQRVFNEIKMRIYVISISLAGNRIPVSRVTGGDTHHYTTENLCGDILSRYNRPGGLENQ